MKWDSKQASFYFWLLMAASGTADRRTNGDTLRYLGIFDVDEIIPQKISR